MANAAYLAFEPADEAVALAVAAELERHGWAVTRAGPELRVSENLSGLIQAVGEASFVVVVASPAAEESAWMRREVAAALNNGRSIILIQGGEMAADSWIAATLDRAQAIDLRRGMGAETMARIAEAARNASTRRGRVIAMLNIKGGVGKTVLAANLFAAAHLADKRAITFIDLDPQHNLTQYFLPPGERNQIRDQGRTIYSVLTTRGEAKPNAFAELAIPLNRIKRAKRPRFDLIAGDERLFEFTLDARAERDKAEAFTRFRALVAALRETSDAVIIDSNPCATFLTRLAITTADHIVAPVRPEKYSLTGLNMLEHVVREVRGRPLRPAEFSVVLNGVNDRTRAQTPDTADALTRAEIAAAPFFGQALLPDEVPYSGALRAVPTDRVVVNPINTTAMMRMGSRAVKESLVRTAASLLRRAAQ
jgi:chromosome partitioning protein